MTSRDVLRSLGVFLAWLLAVGLVVGAIILLTGPLYSPRYDTACTALILVCTLGLLGLAPCALAAKVVFARTLLAWIFGAARAEPVE